MSGRSTVAPFFRQSLPTIGLSIERSTARVPSDGNYYVILGDETKGKFRNKKQALELYEQLVKESGYVPPPRAEGASGNLVVERYLDELESYWSDSHKHTQRGGKGRFR